MNFFEHQDQARKSTRLMIMLYVVAVIGVVTAVTIALAIAWYWAVDERPPAGFYPWAAIGTLGTIVIASLYHIVRLREGGEAIARLVGAQRVAPGTRDPLERRLLNVVEEMAIAAGTRVPAVFVMQGETGINAFAAGYDVSNAVVAVTRGALQTLNRDELQAVVAHEFSHIVNGDMWLNIRMMGVLGGIVFIGAIGEFIMRSQGQSRSRRDSGSGGVFAFGLALMAIGYIGLFFARLIKAAVSRQREFLADASSVQFTRNPTGIAGALDQIRASAGGTLIANRYAEDMSHMFFGQAVKVWLGGMLDTHPPIDERIRRVLPSFGATEYRRGRVSAAVADGEGAPARATEASGKRASDQAHAWGRSVAQSVALAGALEAGKMDYARALIQRVPQQLRDALHKKDSAPAVVVALLLGASMIYCFWLAITTVAFWVVRMDHVLELFEGVYQTGRWPVGVYPGWLRYTVTFLVPVAFAVTVPAEAVTSRLELGTLLLSVGFGLLLFVFTRWFWRFGLRHYSGASA